MLGVLWLGALDSNQELWQDVWNKGRAWHAWAKLGDF